MASKLYINGTRRGLGKYLVTKYGDLCVSTMDECDVFINNKHDGYIQIHRLYQAYHKGKRIINIGSASSDWTKGNQKEFRYALEKKQLRDANDALFYEGANMTIINFGYFDTERSAHKDVPKMSLEYVDSIIMWVLEQPHRVNEITVTPNGH